MCNLHNRAARIKRSTEKDKDYMEGKRREMRAAQRENTADRYKI